MRKLLEGNAAPWAAARRQPDLRGQPGGYVLSLRASSIFLTIGLGSFGCQAR